jgi:hypothetical protein
MFGNGTARLSTPRHFEVADEVCSFCGNQYVIEADTPASIGGKEELEKAAAADAAAAGAGAGAITAGSDGAAVPGVDKRPPPSPIVTPALMPMASPMRTKV